MLENIKNKLENAVYDYLDKHAILDPDEVFESPSDADPPQKEPKPSLFEKFLERWCFVNYCDEEGVERFDQPISPPSDTNAPSH